MFRKNKNLYNKRNLYSTNLIVNNVIDYITKGKRRNLSRGLINSIHQLLEKNSNELRNLVEKLPLDSEESLKLSFFKTMDSMFEDNVYTYARILCILVFGGLIVKRCQKEGKKSFKKFTKQLLEEFIDNNLMDWLNENGGWVS